MCVCVWCFCWKRWAAHIADRLRSWHHCVCMCVRDRAPSGPLWQAHTVAAVRGQSSTLHTTWCKNCKVLHCCLVPRGACSPWWCYFHRDNQKNKACPERQSASCETKQNSISAAALNFHKAKLINNYTPCFYCLNQKVELHDSPQIHLFPCRFVLSTPKSIFDVGLVTGGKSMSQRWEPDLWTTSAHNSRRNLVYWCHILFFFPSLSWKTSVSQGF